ncbi:MAG: GrpB family protein, partial [Saprospiraceae bacterium]|nr:GrpB family protein [Saprospiraceae bacterium]
LETLLTDLHPVVEHIGSTAVEGLSAKPIIDIQVGVENEAAFEQVVERMSRRNDYIYYKVFNETMPGRRLFVKLSGDVEVLGFEKVYHQLEGIPHDALNKKRIAHVHVWVYGTPDWNRHIAFREYLRAYEDVRMSYEQLKLDLSQQEWAHGMAYNDGKNAFVKKVEGEAVRWWESRS